MKNTWWRSESELVDEQLDIIDKPIEEQLAIIGPAGSGKTNLLLLRAKYLFLYGDKNIAIVVFTKTLRDFIVAGCQGYGLPADIVMTSAQWKVRLLKELGGKMPDASLPESERFEALTKAVAEAVERAAGKKYFDAVFVDEVQDYSTEELRIFAATTKALHVAGDSFQRIHQEHNGLSVLRELGLSEVRLTRHFRNGFAICNLADELMKGQKGYLPCFSTSNYDEQTYPCTVTCPAFAADHDMFDDLSTAVRKQLAVYPEDFVGILVPMRARIDEIAAELSTRGLDNELVVETDGVFRFSNDHRLVLSTVHSAKGLEFRAVNLMFPDLLKRFKTQRKLTYTAVTRCKTSLVIYQRSQDSIAPYFASALATIAGPKKLPSRKDLFT